ncbi:E3 binding domain-containing protein, partial [Mesorhizobium sp. NPDC059054]|uniref:E3 binding domain-containing protein n=1 Tax=Mesorhizobium sp. NPDC059054 TaxID=3346711 RepID=UPI00367A271D
MPVEVILPKVDMDMATGQISRWFFEEGATVKQGDVLFEIETDKAAMEIDAPASGTLRNITGKEGVDIPVGAPVAWIYAEGEEAVAPAAPAATASAPAEPQPVANGRVETPMSSSQDKAAQTALAVQETPAPAGAVRATPLARRLAREAGLDLAGISGSGPHGRVVKADVEAAIAGGGVAKAAPTAAP